MFLKIETSVKGKPNQIPSTIIQRRCREEPVMETQDDSTDEVEKNSSTEFLETTKNQLSDLRNHLRRYCNALPVFGFKSAK